MNSTCTEYEITGKRYEIPDGITPSYTRGRQFSSFLSHISFFGMISNIPGSFYYYVQTPMNLTRFTGGTNSDTNSIFHVCEQAPRLSSRAGNGRMFQKRGAKQSKI